MVRLRSKRWYGPDSQLRNSRQNIYRTADARRIVSLCLLLVLIIVLMQTMSDPKHVRRAFSSLGAPLDESIVADRSVGRGVPPFSSLDAPLDESQGSNRSVEVDSLPESSRPEPSVTATIPSEVDQRWVATCRDLVPRLLDSLSNEQVNLLAQQWFSDTSVAIGRDSAARDNIARLRKQCTQVLADSQSRLDIMSSRDRPRSLPQTQVPTDPQRRTDANLPHTSSATPDEQAGTTAAWRESFSKFNLQWIKLLSMLGDERSEAGVPGDIPLGTRDVLKRDSLSKAGTHKQTFDATFSEILAEHLDGRLISSLRDGQSWQVSEFVPFWRTMQRARELRQALHLADVLPVNTRQLDAQTANLRGKIVVFRGSLRRIEKVEKFNPAFGFASGYWQIWMQGEDLLPQPVAIYSTDPELADFAIGASVSQHDSVELSIVALVSKRLAYASQAGIEVAPTLFAIRATPLKYSGVNAVARTSGVVGWREIGLAAVAVVLTAVAVIASFGRRRRRPRKRAENDATPQVPTSHHGSSVCLTLAGFCAALYSSSPLELRAQGAPQETGGTEVRVPWSEPDQQAVARELLDRRLTEAMQGDSRSRIARYLQGDAIGEFPDVILKMLNSVSKIGWQTLAAMDSAARLAGGTLALEEYQGLVRLAAVEPLTSAQLDWYSPSSGARVFRLELEVDDSSKPTDSSQFETPKSGQPGSSPRRRLVVFCRSAPRAWLASARLRQPATVRGLAVHSADPTANANSKGPAELPTCLIIDQPYWSIPSGFAAADLQPDLHPDHYLLGAAGWNLAWLDLLAEKSNSSLSSEEKPAFYTLLKTGQTLTRAWGNSKASTLEAPEVLQHQRESIARHVRWRVRLVKGAIVQVTSEDGQSLLGGKEYFQLDGFVDLNGQRVKYTPQSKDSGGNRESVEFEGEFPITLVSRELPSEFMGGQSRGGSQAWDLGKYAMAEGVFYRVWSYHSERLSSATHAARQVAPLVVLTSLTPSGPPAPRANSGIAWVGCALGAAMIGCLSLIWYYLMPRQRQRHGRNIVTRQGQRL